MADTDTASAKNYKVNVPAPSQPFFLKGSNNLDWGTKNRLSNIFSPETGRTVMLAFDHGYFLGPTSGPAASRESTSTSCLSRPSPTR